jgi:general secretion pathway protein D
MQKVPLLGDIPLLGALFRHKVENNDKTTLVIVLTPYIVKKSDDLDKLRLTLAKLNELEKKFVNKLIKKIKNKNEKN